MLSNLSNDNTILHSRELSPAIAAGALGFVRLAYPHTTEREWVTFVRALSSMPRRTGGLTVIEDSRRYIHGLFSWRILSRIGNSRMLLVSDVIVALLPGKALSSAIVSAIETIAECANAHSIVVEDPAVGGTPFRETLIARGFKPADERQSVIRQTNSRA
jgi:hypothetical protein